MHVRLAAMARNRIGRLALCSAFGMSLAACGGRSSLSTLPSPHAASAARASVTFTMKWNLSAQSSSALRAPKYVPVTARSVSVTVNGGVAAYLNAPATTLSIDAPVGTDTFAFATYDEQNGQGNVLSRASVTQSIVDGAANVVAAALNGVVVSIAVSLSNPAPNAGVPATVNVIASGKDADGNTIVGPGDYSTPIRLNVSDPTASGTLSLSTTTLANPATMATLTYNGGTLANASIVADATGVTSATVTFAPTPTFYQFSIPVSTNRPQWIAQGSDGNMWFTESPGNAVARITPAGVVTEFPIPTAGANPQQIIGATDGKLWFTEFSTNKIAKVTTSGSFTEYSTLFAPPPNDSPFGLVDRGDGNIWYVGNGSSRVGFQGITSGTAGETSIPTANSGAYGIAAASDNNLYYTESNVDKIGRITNLFTAQSEISLATGSMPLSIVRGPDGDVWFTESGTSKIGRLYPAGFYVAGEYPTLTPNARPTGIAVGLDGALWFTENGLDKIGRVTTGGAVTEYASPISGLGLQGIAVGPDGALWFCESGIGLSPGRIGKLVY